MISWSVGASSGLHEQEATIRRKNSFDLDDASVDVWAFPIEPTEFVASTYRPFLSADERVRAGRFKFAPLTHAYTVCRGLARVLLGGYLEIDPGRIEMRYRTKGKPFVPNHKGIDFNVSHTAGMMLCAVTQGCEIGVDVERSRYFPNMEDMARRFFCPEEAEELISLPIAQRTEAFYRCWTRKEAYLKAIGEGLSASLDSFRVTLKPMEEAKLIHIGGDLEHAPHWNLWGLDIDNIYLGAVAYPGPKKVVHVTRCVDPVCNSVQASLMTLKETDHFRVT